MSATETDQAKLEAFEAGLALAAQAGEAQLVHVLTEGGSRCARRAAEAAGELILEVPIVGEVSSMRRAMQRR